MSPMMSDGPTMVLSPPRDHVFAQFPSVLPFAANTGFPNPAPSKPSRKRSRDDAGFEEAMNAAHIEPPAPAPAPKPVEEPIYGEGMVLLNPRTGTGVSAESQTGTWYEEKVEQSAAAAPPVSSRSKTGFGLSSDIQGRKSQRLDPTAPGLDDIALSSIQRRMQDTTDDNSRSGPSHQEPLVDDATRLLGISWQRINVGDDDDDDMAPAVRGWKKYIDNQYLTYLQDCQIMMKSRALNAFLVAAQPAFGAVANSPAYYLFSEDLDQARLVGSTWETCVRNLQSSPVAFEGAETLQVTGKRPDNGSMQAPLGTNTMEAGVPLLQSLSAQPVGNGGLGGLNGGVGMETGMEIDS